MTTTRQQILVYLRNVRAASAREIARALEITPPNARHHLSVLAGDGRVEMLSARKRYGKGRPEKLYSISRSALGNNLAGLASALLAEAGTELPVEALVGRMVDASQFRGQPAARRLAMLVGRLNEMNYQARWEAGAAGPNVILGLCPYGTIVAEHPELCRLDAALLQAMLGGPVEHRLKLAPHCIFSAR